MGRLPENDTRTEIKQYVVNLRYCDLSLESVSNPEKWAIGYFYGSNADKAKKNANAKKENHLEWHRVSRIPVCNPQMNEPKEVGRGGGSDG